MAARNAVDNNFFMVLWPVVVGAMKLYDIITTCQGAWEAYEQGGLETQSKHGLEEATMTLYMLLILKTHNRKRNKRKVYSTDCHHLDFAADPDHIGMYF